MEYEIIDTFTLTILVAISGSFPFHFLIYRRNFYHLVVIMVDAVPKVLRNVCFNEIKKHLPNWKDNIKELINVMDQKRNEMKKKPGCKSRDKQTEEKMNKIKKEDWDISVLLYILSSNLMADSFKNNHLGESLEAIRKIRNSLFHSGSTKSMTNAKLKEQLGMVKDHCKALCEAYGDSDQLFENECQKILKGILLL